MKPNLFKEWNPSASLILLGKTVFSKPSNYNYKLLCLKRSSKSSFMPNTYVFPGGNTSKADSKREWMNLFENHGLSLNILNKLQASESKTSIFEQGEDEIPKCISLRISAIRETFEECGILICQSSKFLNSNVSKETWATYFGGAGIRTWQNRVSKNPSEFLDLCKKYDIYPDLFALKTWSNWLTPSVYKKRFNAIFFMAVLPHLPPAYIDEIEVQELKWETPDEYIRLNSKETIELPLPQFYEISKLRNMSEIDKLLQFAHERSTHGCEEYLPLRINTNHGLFMILPGDDLYPENVELKTSIEFIPSLPQTDKKNRVLQNNVGSKIIIKNFKPKIKHLIPVSDLLY